MADRLAFGDPRLEDYIDGRLPAAERARVAAELEQNPALAAEVERIRRDTDLLQAIGQEVLDEPVPERLRAVLRTPRPASSRPVPRSVPRAAPRSLAQAAAIVLLLGTGVGAGWIANDLLNPLPSARDVMLASVTDAFSFYDESDGYPVDFPADRSEEFRGWIEQVFTRDIEPPDLAEFGYAFDGGRLMPGAGVRVGSFQFTAPEKGRLGVFFWPDEDALPVPLAGRGTPNVAYKVWSGNGFAIAVVGSETDGAFEDAAESVLAFYQGLFGAS